MIFNGEWVRVFGSWQVQTFGAERMSKLDLLFHLEFRMKLRRHAVFRQLPAESG